MHLEFCSYLHGGERELLERERLERDFLDLSGEWIYGIALSRNLESGLYETFGISGRS